MFGLLFTLKMFVNKITPQTLNDQEKEPIKYFQTGEYKLSYMETLSGLRFAISTNVSAGDMAPALQKIYTYYVDYVLRNPTYKMNSEIKLAGFTQRVERYIREISG